MPVALSWLWFVFAHRAHQDYAATSLSAVGKRCELCKANWATFFIRAAFQSDLGLNAQRQVSLKEPSVWRIENRVYWGRGKAAAAHLWREKRSDSGEKKVLRNQILRLKRQICIVFLSNESRNSATSGILANAGCWIVIFLQSLLWNNLKRRKKKN